MLDRSSVHRKLDAKFKIGGVDAADLIAVLLVAGVMNLFFGRMSIGPILIFGPAGILFMVLYFGKRGKPDGFLLSVLKYYLSSGRIDAGEKKDEDQ